MGKMLVFTNAVEGRDDEYNEWYDNVHLGEVVVTPRVRRGRLATSSPTHRCSPTSRTRYLAIYEYKGDAADALAALGAGAATINMSDALAGDAKLVLFEDR